MSNVTAIQKKVQEEPLSPETMLALAAGGDCKALSDGQRLAYLRARCEAAGLDPVTHPFEFTNLNGKLVLYAKKAATDGLSAKHGASITIPSQVTDGGVRTVTARASDPSGRVMEDVGCVWVDGLKGNDLANAHMKAVTKAKRRAVLSMYGLGDVLDETEIADIPAHARRDPSASPTPPPLPKVVEAEVVPPPPPPPVTSAPAGHVLALWHRVLALHKKNKQLAQADWDRAASLVFGDAPVASSKWTKEQTAEVEAHLFPKDVP